MKKIINCSTLCAFTILFYSCAPSRNDLICASKSNNLAPATFMQNLSKTIENSIPEFCSISMQSGAGTSASGAWTSDRTSRPGEEYTRAAFALRNNIRYHPAGEFPRETNRVPYMDIRVTVTRFASAGDAQNELKKELRLRPAAPAPAKTYKGALLYKYSSGEGTIICQSEQYIVEINPFVEAARPLTLKLLDTVLEQIKSDSSKVD